VTALSFSLLGPEEQQFSWRGQAVAVLRLAHYDCAARTMTITAQADWDRMRALAWQSQTAFVPLHSGVEIAAACSDDPGNSPGFTSTDAAWDDARTHWPAAPYMTWATCLWAQMPEELRTSYVEKWTPMGIGSAGFYATQDQADAGIAACGIPLRHSDMALGLLRTYAGQRAALRNLAKRDIDEPKITAAWVALPIADRKRVESQLTGPVDPIVALSNALADKLGVAASDTEVRNWLFHYTLDQLWLETG
jgi:hypothetical protein